MDKKTMVKMIDLGSIILDGKRLIDFEDNEIINSLIIMNWRKTEFDKIKDSIEGFFKDENFLFSGKTPDAWLLILHGEIERRMAVENERRLMQINRELEQLTDKKTRIANLKAERDAILNSDIKILS